MTEKEMEEKIKNCDHHVYAIIKHGFVFNGDYHHPVIECIKCGLTNKNVERDKKRSLYEDFNFRSVETRLFRNYAFFLDKKDYDDANYISERQIGTYYPSAIFEIAKQVCLSLDIDSKECYPMIEKVMNDLSEIAQNNNLTLTKEEDINELISIYSNEKDKTYKKQIK